MNHVKSFEEMNPEQQFAYLMGQRSRDAEFEQLAKERARDWPQEEEPYDGEHCQNCGRSYATVYHLPDDVWKRISPKGNEGGLLCPPCAAAAAYDAGINLWWEAAENEYPTAVAQAQVEAADEVIELHRKTLVDARTEVEALREALEQIRSYWQPHPGMNNILDSIYAIADAALSGQKNPEGQ